MLVGLLAPVIGFVYIRYMYWSKIADGVEITERQLPEVYKIYTDLARDMGFTGTGLKAVPRLFLVNGNGVMNAFASKCRIQQGYVVIYSDIVDLAYEHGNFGAIRFVLAHELGHIKCGHVSLWRNAVSPIMNVLFLAKSLSRAQEYTADRVAAYYAGDNAMDMLALFSGKNVAKQVDPDEYVRNIGTHKNGFWLRFANFLSDHAVGFRRMKALSEVRIRGWNVHGKML